MCEISKQQFIECIKSLQTVLDFQREILKTVRKYDSEADFGIFNYPSCEYELLRLLETLMNDDEGWISYFCYEIDFGREWEVGDATDEDGVDIPLATVDELWETLTNR